MSFNDFVRKYKLKNKATSNIENQQVPCSLCLNNVGIYLRFGRFESDIGSVYLHPSRKVHWVVYTNEIYFDSHGCSTPQKLSKFIMKGKKHCSYSKLQNTMYN